MKKDVIENIVLPLGVWFDKEMPKGLIEAYIDVLCTYPAEILKQAMKDVKNEWEKSTIPQPSIFRKICEKHLVSRKPYITPDDRIKHSYMDVARSILPTEIGQLAIKNTVANSLVGEAFASGKKDFDTRDIERFVRNKRKAMQQIQTLNENEPLDKPLLNLWNSMQIREKEFKTAFWGGEL